MKRFITLIASLLTFATAWSQALQTQIPDAIESQSPGSPPLSEEPEKEVTRLKDIMAKRAAARAKKKKQQALQEARDENHLVVPPKACEPRPMYQNRLYIISPKDFPRGDAYLIDDTWKDIPMLALADGVRSAQTSIFFPHPSDQYIVKLLPTGEDDGHSFQEILINNEVIIEHEVPVATGGWKMIGPEYHRSSDVVEIKKGDVLTIRSTTPKELATNATRARLQEIQVIPFVSKPRGRALPAAATANDPSAADQNAPPATSHPIPEKHGIVKAQRSEKHSRNSDGSYPILSTDFPLGDCLWNYKARWIGLKPEFGSVETSVYFPYPTRRYDVSFTPVAENGGQAQHEVFINGVPILKATAPKAWDINHVQASKPVSTSDKIKISRGDLITVKSKIISITDPNQCSGHWDSINFFR